MWILFAVYGTGFWDWTKRTNSYLLQTSKKIKWKKILRTEITFIYDPLFIPQNLSAIHILGGPTSTFKSVIGTLVRWKCICFYPFLYCSLFQIQFMDHFSIKILFWKKKSFIKLKILTIHILFDNTSLRKLAIFISETNIK